MKWSFGPQCFRLSTSAYDLLSEILTSTHEALRTGFMEMSPSELTDFNDLCDQAELSLAPLTPASLPTLRRILCGGSSRVCSSVRASGYL